MSAQPSLFDTPAPAPKLGPRQQLVLDAIAATEPDGVTADEVGALIHEHRGTHDRDSRCDFCAKEGNGVLRRLTQLEVVTRRRADGRWHLRNAPRPTSQDAGAIPF